MWWWWWWWWERDEMRAPRKQALGPARVQGLGEQSRYAVAQAAKGEESMRCSSKKKKEG
jgi:hypothetical protein